MEKVRIGNDIQVKYTVLRDGLPESFVGATNIAVNVKNEAYGKIIPSTFSIVDNVVNVVLDAKDCVLCGKHRVTLSYNRGNDITIDALAFELVQFTSLTGGTEIVGVEIVTVNISGDIGINRDGASAYEVWEAYPGNEGKTIEQYFTWLRENPTKVDTSRTITAGNGLTGGGSLTEDRTININPADDSLTVTDDNIKVNTNNTLTSTSTTQPLSANQGKVLNDKVVQVETDLNETDIKNAEQDASIKSIEQLLSQSNLNQTAQVSSTGREIVSLPKTASNGGMEVKLEGLTAQNLVVNGDFRNGETGWTAARSVNTVSNNTLINTGNGAHSNPFAQLPSIQNRAGDVVYLRYKFRVTNSDCKAHELQGGGFAYRLSSPIQNLWYNISQRATASMDSVLLPHSYEDAATANGKVMEVQRVIYVNLTTTFGAGNEPDLATCDAMFSSYFEGTKSFIPTGRVRSVGKNLFNGKLEYGTILSSDGAESPSSLVLRSKFIRVKPNSRYQFSDSLNLIDNLYYYDINKKLISEVSRSVFNSNNNPTQCFYVRFRTNTNDINYNRNIQLEQNSVSTSFVSYRDSKLYITTPELRSNGLVKDEIRKGANGYELVKRVGVGTLGAELITNVADREFDTGYTWLLGGNWTIADGVLTRTSQYGTVPCFIPLLTVGNTYSITLNIKSYTSGGSDLFVGDGASIGISVNVIGAGSYTVCWKALNKDLGIWNTSNFVGSIESISVKKITTNEGVAMNSKVTEYGANVHYTLGTPIVTPIEHVGILNSAESGTVYHEPVVADAGVYGANLTVLNTTYQISSIEEIIVHTNVGTYLDVSKAVIASDGLSFTHPDLRAGDLVLFTYFFSKEKVNGLITATYYDGRYVIADTANGKFYKWGVKATNGVAIIQLTEV